MSLIAASLGGILIKKGVDFIGNLLTGASNKAIDKLSEKIKDKTGIDLKSIDSEADLSSEQVVQLKQFETDERKYILDVMTEQMRITNTTMQSESESERWPQYSWRPFWGFASGSLYFIVGCVLCFILIMFVKKNPADAFASMPLIISSFTGYFAIAGAVVGVTAWQRGKEKQIKLGG